MATDNATPGSPAAPKIAPGISPGTRIQIKVVKRPTNAAATKTLVRLLSKDRRIIKENDHLGRIRKENLTQHQRGGRRWNVRVVTQRRVFGKLGEAGTITASTDVLTDLKSVAKFVEVTPA